MDRRCSNPAIACKSGVIVDEDGRNFSVAHSTPNFKDKRLFESLEEVVEA